MDLGIAPDHSASETYVLRRAGWEPPWPTANTERLYVPLIVALCLRGLIETARNALLRVAGGNGNTSVAVSCFAGAFP